MPLRRRRPPLLQPNQPLLRLLPRLSHRRRRRPSLAPPSRSLRPFDTETIVASVKKTNHQVSVEEGWPFAGIGSELSALMMEHAFDYLDAPVKRVAGLDIPLPYAANLEKMALPQANNIVEAARAVCNR